MATPNKYVKELNSFETLRDEWFALIEPEFNAAEELNFEEVPFDGDEDHYRDLVYDARNKWIMAELRKAGKTLPCDDDDDGVDYIYVLTD